MMYMRDNPTADPAAFDPEAMRQDIRDAADVGSDKYFTDIYNSLENDLTNTEVGQILENVGANATRGGIAAATGNLFGAFGADPLAATKMASNLLMGYGVAGTTTGEKIDEGYDPDRALLYGTLSGLNEMGQEQIGEIGAAIGKKTGLDKYTSWLFNQTAAGMPMGIKDWSGEFVEEGLGQLQEPLMDLILNPGMTVEEAVGNALSKENRDAALKAGLEGFLSAGISAGLTHPAQTAQMVKSDIQELQNLPAALDRDLTQISNKINKTNEYEKAKKTSLIDDLQNQVDLMPAGADRDAAMQTLKTEKEKLWNQFGTKENLRSDDVLVREAAEAANYDRIVTQATETGMDEQRAKDGAELANLLKETFQVRDRNSFVTDYDKNANGVFDPVTGEMVISTGTTDPFAAVVSHEAGGHAKEGTQEFRQFINSVAKAADAGKIKLNINGVTFSNTSSLVDSIGRGYLADYLEGQAKEEYKAFFDDEGHLKDKAGYDEFIKREDIQDIINSEQFQDMLDSERSAYLTQVAVGTREAIDYLKGNRSGIRALVDTLDGVMARITNNQTKLNELDRKKTLQKALDLYKQALSEDTHYENTNAGYSRMARDMVGTADQAANSYGTVKTAADAFDRVSDERKQFIIKKIARNAFTKNREFVPISEQITGMKSNPQTFGFAYVPTANTLEFAHMDGDLFFSKTDLEHMENHLPDDEIIRLLDNLPDFVVLASDYRDVRNPNASANVNRKTLYLLDNNKNIYFLSARKNSNRTFTIDEISSLYQKRDVAEYIKKATGGN
ncbi:MAG: hypothetical protein K6F23_11005, partial [Solobacterium sp.]|nr:hypothetical protein [Solobacterium sp.]